ncbi:MAG: methyltransferase domain-containing protein [Nitrospira sp.]|uniref:Arsenite methyltransferase n=1 Tax=Nitrospira defluvii TaxID=330214 RepID=A0ABM8RJT9_9BACT|nr:methyltransferase domain-containing protein [Nitrospira defluvii]MCS6326159.1 methyltransferase domain-containing protein [Nitrospira sp.]CAE6756923.1 Ubiquinone biosynthesis methyltransferase UbiE [Nitrospira defluvii]
MPTDDITQKVSERYAKAASTGEQMCCPTSYDMSHLKTFIPEEVLKISYGCGTPAGLDTVETGETVLDIGSGGGIDCFEASRVVGPSGRVIGIDMTDTMLEIARRNAPLVAANLGYPKLNTEFRKGMADAMPVEDASIDLIISNCVINLAPDKRKVFREMYRVLKPGGRFTISDIVSDQVVPQYMVHDSAKWGDCLSGALQVQDYIGGMVDAGFRAVHQIKSTAWQSIDGIHFLSVTLTGYKFPAVIDQGTALYATLCGPFSSVTDELGQQYRRGVPQSIDAERAQLLRTAPLRSLFLIGPTPTTLDSADPRWCAILPEQTPCVWQGAYAILTGPVISAEDDDHHQFYRGVPLEICSKTLHVLNQDAYRPHFTIYHRSSSLVEGGAVSCSPGGNCC